MSLYQELKRRNVLRVAAAYTVAAWLLVQVAETIFPLFGYGDAPARIVVIMLAIGFIPALIISWVFEITPEGLKRDADVDHSKPSLAGKKLDRMIIAALVVAVVYFAVDKFVLDPQRDIEMTETAAIAGAEQAREEARLDRFSDKSIAVLPFANRSEQKDDEYFTDGMHDELLTRLSRISELKVISRTSMMKYRGQEKSIPNIAKELSVATVLEGGVQRVGNQVRINVQLIDARTDEHIWAEIYDRELTTENLFAIQSEISTEIAESLEATLTPGERTRVYALPTSSLEAYNHFLRGRQSMALRTREGLEQALADFEQATEVDPEFALAWVGIGDTVHLLMEVGGFEPDAAKDKKRVAVERALELDDQLGEAYTSMIFVYGTSGDIEKRDAAFEKAIEFSPNYAQAYHWYANSLSGAEAAEKRLPLLYKAAQLDPRSSVIQMNIASIAFNQGELDEARDATLRVVEMDPGYTGSHRFLGQMDLFEGRLASAIGYLRKAVDLDPGNRQNVMALALAHNALGDFEAAGRVLEKMVETLGPASVPYQIQAYWNLIAKEEYQDAIGVLEVMSERGQEHNFVFEAYARAYLLSGDYQSAREYLFKAMPFLEERDLARQEFTDNAGVDCEFAGAIYEAGDDLGRGLIQLRIQRYEEQMAANEPDVGWSEAAMLCYLADGQLDVALDILDRESAKGRISRSWFYVSRLPWWEPLKDDPRFLDLVERMEGMLDEQRALLN